MMSRRLAERSPKRHIDSVVVNRHSEWDNGNSYAFSVPYTDQPRTAETSMTRAYAWAEAIC
jgi:hypothetical protein